MGIIYQAENLINEKKYIGQTRSFLDHRKAQHRNKMNKYDSYFFRALKKHGWESFEWSILEEDIHLENLNEREVYWIQKLDTFNRKNGYNSTSGGDQKKEVSLETREKISIARSGKKLSKEHCRNISLAHKGKDMTLLTEAARIANTGRKRSKDCIAKIINTKSCFWEVTNPEGLTFKISNLKKFCKRNNLNHKNMSAVASGKEGRKQHKGWKCKKLIKILERR